MSSTPRTPRSTTGKPNASPQWRSPPAPTRAPLLPWPASSTPCSRPRRDALAGAHTTIPGPGAAPRSGGGCTATTATGVTGERLVRLPVHRRVGQAGGPPHRAMRRTPRAPRETWPPAWPPMTHPPASSPSPAATGPCCLNPPHPRRAPQPTPGRRGASMRARAPWCYATSSSTVVVVARFVQPIGRSRPEKAWMGLLSVVSGQGAPRTRVSRRSAAGRASAPPAKTGEMRAPFVAIPPVSGPRQRSASPTLAADTRSGPRRPTERGSTATTHLNPPFRLVAP
jgi:hypothetical protein